MTIGGTNPFQGLAGMGGAASPAKSPMKIEEITPKDDAGLGAAGGAGGAGGSSFGDAMKDAVMKVNDLQGGADSLAQKLATGDVQDVHQVMLALNQASNAFGLTVQVRNKAVEAYQEIMRMQV